MLFTCRFRYQPEDEGYDIDAENKRLAAEKFAAQQYTLFKDGDEKLKLKVWDWDHNVIVTPCVITEAFCIYRDDQGDIQALTH